MYVRFSVFTDYGQRYLIDPGSRPGSLSMWGAGFSVNATIGDRFDFRFTYGISLKDIPGVTAGSSRFSFAIGGQF
jgi:hemolysin activation/secretion protein